MTQSPSTQQSPFTGFMRLQQVLVVFPVSKSTWWTGVKDGRFPAPVKLSTRITAWRTEDIQQLVERHKQIV